MANQTERPKIMSEIRSVQNHQKEIERSLMFKNPNYQGPTLNKASPFSNLNTPKEVVVLENPPGNCEHQLGKMIIFCAKILTRKVDLRFFASEKNTQIKFSSQNYIVVERKFVTRKFVKL